MSKPVTRAKRNKIKAALLADVPTRIKKLQREMRASNLDAMYLNDNISLRYFTGFNGHDTSLLIGSTGGKNAVWLITDFRLFEEAEQSAPNAKVILHTSSREKAALEISKEKKYKNIGFDNYEIQYQTFKHLDKLSKEIKGAKFTLHPHGDLLKSIYVIKSQAEVDALKVAVDVAQIAQLDARNAFLAGASELEVARAIDRRSEDLGGEEPSFKTIVAYDKRSSLCHAVPTDVRPKKNSFMLTDWGTTFEGYRSDLTRVFAPNSIPSWLRELHEIVLSANRAAVKMLQSGIEAHLLDARVREIFSEAGMEKNFGHGLGHGFGLRIHEAPFISRNTKVKLKVGMVVTIEPGLYIEGRGGVRIEDDLLITKDGAKSLSSYPRELF